MQGGRSSSVAGARTTPQGVFDRIRRVIVAPARRVLGTVICVETTEPVIALTFDDGPDPEYLPALLQVLATHQVQATFFMVGRRAAEHPDIVRQVAAAGHAIGSHSWSHHSLPELTWRDRLKEMRRGGDALDRAYSRLFRPPYGHQTLQSRLEAYLLGLEVIGWSVDVWDWLKTDSATIAADLEHKAGPGDIVLLHDGYMGAPRGDHQPDRTAMIEGLDRYLARARSRYQFVTVPELLRRGRVVRVNWVRRRRSRG